MQKQCIAHLISNFLVFFCLFYILSFLPIYICIIIQRIFVIIFALIGIVEIFLIINFHDTLNLVFFDTLLSTNPNESLEFLNSYITKPLPFLLGFTAFSILFFCTKSNKDNLKILTKKFKIILLIIFIISTGVLIKKFDSFITNDKMYLKQWIDIIYQTFINQNEMLKEIKIMEGNLDKSIKSTNYQVEIKNAIPKIALIIGESTQRNYMNLYGYPLKNTQNLSQKTKNGELFIFNDIISSYSHTNQALESVLTFKNYENSSTAWYKHMNLIDILKLAGYKTFWLSNQESVASYGNSYSVIAKRSHITKYSSQRVDGKSPLTYDGILLDIFKTLPQTKENSFYIFHLLGTHRGYKERYPANFEKFTYQDIKTDINLDKKQSKIVANYVNAILYNDKIVSDIMDKFKDDEAIVFYLSDHGEEVYDFRDFAGHSDTMASRYMVEIPFMIYVSSQLKQNRPDIIKKIQNAQNLPFMSDDFIHAFMDIAGIKSKDFNNTRSLFDNAFNASRKRFYSGKDYDLELKP